ncbi:cytochrome c3 family protein [Desulforhopalus singaporensis]|uniref:Class III cytochrome C family protein n=1 Tax=Desulforhopalus singaporensis TaxID=91360 RepID=A0A1H0S654_9BACT|nr:cytochrome c3 family protein [Desulforhopalus singaporensis]SDP36718.1 Class III cytochrome C family protein [Desulforhopalus singaporensis]
MVRVKIDLFPLLSLFFIIFPVMPTTAAFAAAVASTVTIDALQELYTPVDFDHLAHAEMYNCTSCHHHTTGTTMQDEKCLKCHKNSPATANVSCSSCHHRRSTALDGAEPHGNYHIDIVGLKGALHLNCLGCHRETGAPCGCIECHDYTEAGRKRFAVQEN